MSISKNLVYRKKIFGTKPPLTFIFNHFELLSRVSSRMVWPLASIFQNFSLKILDVAVKMVKKWSTEPKFGLDPTLNLLKTCLNIVFKHFEQLCRVTSRATRPLGSIFTHFDPLNIQNY